MIKALIGAFFFLLSVAPAQKWDISRFIADTLMIPLTIDSSLSDSAQIAVRDNRPVNGQVVGVRQIKRWLYFPVDQYFVLEAPLAEIVARFLSVDTLTLSSTIIIDHLTVWKDAKPLFAKGWVLNGYTRLVGTEGETINDWQWELRAGRQRKKKTEEIIGQLLVHWMDKQKESLAESWETHPISPYRYRRQLLFWLDAIYLSNGYILDGRLSLDYPTDQMKSFIRGVRGIYYRKSAQYESIAIGGKDQQWYSRFSPLWLGRLNVTGRIGFNSFDPDKFDYVDWWNIFLIQIGLKASIEYRPVYHKGIFAGIGVYQSMTALPEIVERFETGLLVTVGWVLP